MGIVESTNRIICHKDTPNANTFLFEDKINHVRGNYSQNSITNPWGKTSFNEFRHSKEKIASNILASRLAKLVDYGIFEKKENPVKKSKIDYFLTDRGRSLESILMAIGNWGYENISGVNDSAAYFNAKG
ncbi:MAG: helix-turn-helix transcriptional regulator [Saprospiraceae bacterium]|nr:helix-turn-helix transcriptional regulator [Saprospiraceae bacterium]